MIRIKFTGDIMCGMAQNAACRTENGYDYERIFTKAKKYLQDCDYLVGNLETTLSGEALQYSCGPYSFNTPDCFAETLKNVGFDLVSTANNHCMDRGIEGLARTLEVLDRIGIDHIGTHLPGQFKPFVKEIGGINMGFVTATYGTNAFFHHTYLPEGWKDAVQLLQPEEFLEGSIHLLDEDKIPVLTKEYYGQPNEVFDRLIAPFHAQLQADIDACRAAGAEYVIFILHCGGQYNPMPDDYTKHMARTIRNMGVDAIVGHHPHVIHPMVDMEGVPVHYSLGNFSYSPGADPRGKEIRGQWSDVLCLTIDKEKGIVDIQHEWMKSVQHPDSYSEVVPAEILLAEADEEERKIIEEDIRFCENLVRTPV